MELAVGNGSEDNSNKGTSPSSSPTPKDDASYKETLKSFMNQVCTQNNDAGDRQETSQVNPLHVLRHRLDAQSRKLSQDLASWGMGQVHDRPWLSTSSASSGLDLYSSFSSFHDRTMSFSNEDFVEDNHHATEGSCSWGYEDDGDRSSSIPRTIYAELGDHQETAIQSSETNLYWEESEKTSEDLDEARFQ